MKKHFLLVLVMVTVGGAALPQQVIDEPDAIAPEFLLRVDPQLAPEINQILARVAHHMKVVVPVDKTAEEYLSQICGGNLPAYEVVETPETGAATLRVAPCVRIKRNLRINVTAGDTLEGLAVRNGLPRTAARRLRIVRSGESTTHLANPENLQIGDVVVIPEVPQWTNVLVNPDIVADRAALVSALASRLNCRTEDTEECLADHKVIVLDRATVRQPSEPKPTSIEFDELLRENISVSKLFAEIISEAVAYDEAAEVIMGKTPSTVAAPAAASPVDVVIREVPLPVADPDTNASEPNLLASPALSMPEAVAYDEVAEVIMRKTPSTVAAPAAASPVEVVITEMPLPAAGRNTTASEPNSLAPPALSMSEAVAYDKVAEVIMGKTLLTVAAPAAASPIDVVITEVPLSAVGPDTTVPAPNFLVPTPSMFESLSTARPLPIPAARDRWSQGIGSLAATSRGGKDMGAMALGLCTTKPPPFVLWTPESLSQFSSGLQMTLLSAATSPTPRILAPPPAPPVPASLCTAMTAASIPVAPEQWPYDTALLIAILKDAADAGFIDTGTIIGVADLGLGSISGSPLPEGLFGIGDEKRDDEKGEEPDDHDNDGNRYVDDFFGAGVGRVKNSENLGNGDLGLCATAQPQPTFASWSSDRLERFSHGAVVSSVAAALGLRKIAPQVSDALPKLIFFRMLENACAEDARDSPSDADMVQAFDYLNHRLSEIASSRIINISYVLDENEKRNGFVDRAKEVLPYRDVLLVIPAGNDWPGDLDRTFVCPPCLGEATFGGSAAKRTLVVGAATRDLRRARYSNFGEHTVGIFAPGEPIGALDLAEKDFSLAEPATSYATPLAALAAGIINSFGTSSATSIKDRLMATTWPLFDEDSHTDRTHVGVLDLVKAAAVRHHAVEVMEAEPDGQCVRRTYVGKLLTPLKKLKFLCDGPAPRGALVHAIRLGEPVEDGERQLLFYFRKQSNPRTGQRLIQAIPCRPEGELSIETLPDGKTKTFPLSQVTQIQLPWIL